MTGLLGAMDVSGNPAVGNHRFLSIVPCTSEYLDCLTRRLESRQIRLRDPKNSRNRSQIASELTFDGINGMALCCRINRDAIIDKFMKQKTKRNKKPMRGALRRSFNRQTYGMIRERISDFLINKEYGIHDIWFQCDSDCMNFAKDVGLHHTVPGDAHVVSDVIAWMNNRGKEPHGVISLDLADKISQVMNIK